MATALIGGRRSAAEIIHEILTLCNNGGINKTAIMYKSNLSYDQLRRYLSALCDDEYLSKNGAGNFETTPGGRKTLKRMANAIKTLKELRREFGGRPA